MLQGAGRALEVAIARAVVATVEVRRTGRCTDAVARALEHREALLGGHYRGPRVLELLGGALIAPSPDTARSVLADTEATWRALGHLRRAEATRRLAR